MQVACLESFIQMRVINIQSSAVENHVGLYSIPFHPLNMMRILVATRTCTGYYYSSPAYLKKVPRKFNGI